MTPKIISSWGSRNALIPGICGSRASRSHVPSEQCWVLSATNIPSFYGFGSVNTARFQVGMALSWRNDPKNSREYLGIVLLCLALMQAPASGAVTSARPHLAAFLHQSEPAWGTIPEALTSFGILQPAHPFFHHGPGITSSTWAKNSCCSPGTWERSKLIY